MGQFQGMAQNKEKVDRQGTDHVLIYLLHITHGFEARLRTSALFLTLLSALTLSAQNAPSSPDWSEPLPPHHVLGNVYYVGTKGLACYLITTPQGHILLNSGLTNTAPLIQTSVEKLGFKVSDIKILLISHAHWDHCAGSSALIKLTGAKYMVMDADVAEVEAGGKGDFNYAESPDILYPPVTVDRVLHDGDEVQLGNTTLVAHKTPGHTKGCTTWTFKVADDGKMYDVVVVGSPNVNPGYKLVANPSYPQIAQDYETTFRVLKSLPCDVFLGAHGDYYGMEGKLRRLGEGGSNPFIDPEGYKRYVAASERMFLIKLKGQQSP
jgi:metallo-beta-lactamase class B